MVSPLLRAENATDKVAALRAVAKEMTEKGLQFDSDHSEQEVISWTDKMTPQEILQAWKESHGDAASANADFINNHR
jgi:hypothetical protein